MLMVMICLGCLLISGCCSLSLTGAWWMGFLDLDVLGLGKKDEKTDPEAKDPSGGDDSSGSISTTPAGNTTSTSFSCTGEPCPCPADLPAEMAEYAGCQKQ